MYMYLELGKATSLESETLQCCMIACWCKQLAKGDFAEGEDAPHRRPLLDIWHLDNG